VRLARAARCDPDRVAAPATRRRDLARRAGTGHRHRGSRQRKRTKDRYQDESKAPGEERFYSLGQRAPSYGSNFALASFGVHDFPPKLYSHYLHTRANPRIAFASFQPSGPSQQRELMHHLPGYRLARCALHPHPRLGWGTLPQSPTTFRLVFQSDDAHLPA
jgi:hypothetical protein